MDIFLQTLLGSVMLNQHVDEESSYYEFFSGWISRNQHKWGVMTTRAYQNAVGRSEEYLLTTHRRTEKKLQLEISERSLPWLVLASHVLLGFTTDAAQISELMVFCGFRRVHEKVIKSIVEWSTYPSRLNMGDTSQEYTITAFENLQKAFSEGDGSESIGWRRLGYQKLMWKTIYQHHLSTPDLNPMFNTAGIIFYGLISLDDDRYAVLFIDAVTEALQFSRQFSANNEIELAQHIADTIAAYMKEYGHPWYFILLNPLRGWLHSTMSKALGMLTEPSACQFIAPRQLTANLKLVPTKVEALLSSIQQMLQDESIMKEYPPFSLVEYDGPWPLVFVENLHWSQHQLSSTHPNVFEQVSKNNPELKFAKELRVVDLPSLETGEISHDSFELLKCQAPSGVGQNEGITDNAGLQDELLDRNFASLMKRSNEFNIVPGRDYQTSPVDYISRKMVLHIWQCFKLRETMATNGQTRMLDFDDLVHVLSRGHDVYKVINHEEALWQSKGVEIAHGLDDCILIFIGADSAIQQVTWWEEGRLGWDVFSQESMVSFLPKTVEEAVEEGGRRDAPIQLSESDDEDPVNAKDTMSTPTQRRSRRVREQEVGSAETEEPNGYDFDSSSEDDLERTVSDPALPAQAQRRTSTQVPAHLRGLYDSIDPAMREGLYNKKHPLIRNLVKLIPKLSDRNMTEDSRPFSYDIREALGLAEGDNDVETNGN
ncbi:YALI0F28633p [Yarrowia lipolytica CLIB122]|uniref:YALI0F28633p n=2 Tax=Yarrowia lipolytica TaxID=4952 RepID=Q6C013_YARLI|nr:YALI0F28633p [Yarrowia lipolytica CLIB122]AOW07844.1 hypothetical protein YALI1_F36344g [Yarrowia lipolytica]KAB8285851.1 hypothetical protein BKA91DRAFT_132263 [Yarrowia lipolytica]KAE8168964.1 hypothetical protein BKA90DRAFT_143398 [Yarrowia lipolytica]KAJ8055113.1 hypothetical protein LXG23DRAFT_34781 [Yarrowia lipolytica]RMI99891.1 hypothetical protein BD777DRAFT_122452 [Yarrowia lipolytica]|eukprot:XP_505999.1 YALI0F28633p [Yarrowia lipolytica CLIB122]